MSSQKGNFSAAAPGQSKKTYVSLIVIFQTDPILMLCTGENEGCLEPIAAAAAAERSDARAWLA